MSVCSRGDGKLSHRFRQSYSRSLLLTMNKSFRYRGAFNQYHAALLLLVEVYAYPMRKEAARIWKCMDYIFEIPPHLAPKQKAELVITDLRDRMLVYNGLRRVKISNQMLQRVNASARSPEEIAPQQEANVSLLGRPSFSPAPSDATENRQQGGDMTMAGIEDIDWVSVSSSPHLITSLVINEFRQAEWEKVFNPEHYTGDLNIPDFNMTEFTGSGDFYSTGTGAGASAGAGPAMGFNLQTAANFGAGIGDGGDLEDVRFTPAFFPTTSWQAALGEWKSN